VKAALQVMGLLESDAVRAPLLPMEEGPRDQLATLLRSLGLVEMPGGRVREAVA
jgi:dihydrodipicolinate synthase/N-acetylneuraminate lyase